MTEGAALENTTHRKEGAFDMAQEHHSWNACIQLDTVTSGVLEELGTGWLHDGEGAERLSFWAFDVNGTGNTTRSKCRTRGTRAAVFAGWSCM